jgi:hypothetical protein
MPTVREPRLRSKSIRQIARALVERVAVNRIGANGFSLVVAVAVWQEETRSNAVELSDAWLMSLSGISSQAEFRRTRKACAAAGWLKVGKSKRSRLPTYTATIPPRHPQG